MATIYNSDLTKELIEGAKIQIMRESVPNQIAEKVVPVMEVNPKLLRRTNVIINNNNSSTGSATIKVLPTGMNFYITAISLQVIKDAANDVADGQVTITAPIDGLSSTLINLPVLTLTAQNIGAIISFTYPIRLDAGGTISLVSNAFAAGKMRRIIQIFGYYDEKIGA